jgi:SAM-dependent methyltransferase
MPRGRHLDATLSDEKRAVLYKAHRDRSATTYKKKHAVQYDHEFKVLTDASPSMSVLEIGCGTGLFLRYLEDRGYREFVGLDMDEGLRHSLRDLARSEIYLEDVQTVLRNQLAGRTFDRIVMLDVAEHLRLDVLQDLLQVLREHTVNGGKLLLRVPNVESPWGLKMFFGTFDHVTPLGPGRMHELALLTGWVCSGVFPQEPQRTFRRLKERILNRVVGSFLSYHPDIWTANLLAVYQSHKSKRTGPVLRRGPFCFVAASAVYSAAARSFFNRPERSSAARTLSSSALVSGCNGFLG